MGFRSKDYASKSRPQVIGPPAARYDVINPFMGNSDASADQPWAGARLPVGRGSGLIYRACRPASPARSCPFLRSSLTARTVATMVLTAGKDGSPPYLTNRFKGNSLCFSSEIKRYKLRQNAGYDPLGSRSGRGIKARSRRFARSQPNPRSRDGVRDKAETFASFLSRSRPLLNVFRRSEGFKPWRSTRLPFASL
jgi:hypothetical protein